MKDENVLIILHHKTTIMTSSLYYQCMLAGTLGILFHMLVIKYPDLKKRAAAANSSLTLKSFLSDDWGSMMASFVTVIIGILIVDELLYIKPEMVNYIKFFFATVGYMGSSVLQLVFGIANKKILNIIDTKTNIADGVTSSETSSDTPPDQSSSK
jgi:uncharacterized membrane protein